ncbi:hypothetical protein MSAN_01747900 [Mycena sanguinolenta]|uniref:Uncharacterized protein n=1 Tax=Mycena sanguinolenta TaxID=230812 RepID=A0A8H6XTQ5_9AGAR|nr:hypothetical protein MSAN_01747900 [Mycena sanguinolenta]
MPVTIRLTDHRPTSKTLDPVTPSQILERACPDQSRQADTILRYSIGGCTEKPGIKFKIIPNGCGFVDTVLSAYTGSHALVLRPDDIWLTVISQFSLYVNANPELLLDHTNFGSREPRQPLVIVDPNSPQLSTQMGESIQRNVLDREWALPKFSTTTPHDIAVVSMLRIAPAVRKAFLPRTETLHRGIPRVTLDGLRTDWELLLQKLKKLKEYGIPAIAWYHLLHPVVSQIAKSFYDQNNPEIREFWKKVVHEEGFGGRSSKLSGWITAFSLFSCEGECRIPQLRTTPFGKKDPAALPPHRFWSIYAPSLEQTSSNMTIDGIKYPVINIHDLATGYAEVNVIVNHGGIAAPRVIVAGLTGVGFASSGDRSPSSSGKNDTVRPVVAWWMFSKLEQAQPQSHEHEPDIINPLELPTVLPDFGDGLSPAVNANPIPPSFVLAGSA